MKIKIKNIFLLVYITVFASCVKEVPEIKLPAFEHRQVLSAYFTDEMDSLRLYLAVSVPATGDEEESGIEGADVGLFYHNEKVLSFESEGNGFYHAYVDTFEFVEGEEYAIRSKVNGFPDIVAKAKLPRPVKLDSIDVESYNDGTVRVKISFVDLIGQDYYGFFRAPFYFNDTLIDRGYPDFPRLGSSYVYKAVTDETFDGDRAVVSFFVIPNVGGVNIWKPNTKVVGAIVNIPKIWYEYEQALEYNVPEPDDIFLIYSTENMPTNVDGGYGLFGLGNEERIEKYY